MGSMFRGLCLLGRNPGNHQAHKATSWLDKRPGKLLDTPLVEEEIGCMADLAQELCQGLSTRTWEAMSKRVGISTGLGASWFLLLHHAIV